MQKSRFLDKINTIPKDSISVLQINLGRRCNQTCRHCHVEASPNRTETVSEDVKSDLIKVIQQFDQIKTIDFTGGAPEYHYGFRELVKAATEYKKEVIVRSNLTICLEKDYEDLPSFFADQGVTVVASLPCYLEQNVDSLRGNGVYQKSIRVIRMLNEKGYGDSLILDLVYSPTIPDTSQFSLAPDQQTLENDYKKYLKEHFDIHFNSLLTITNIPLGRFYHHLKTRNLHTAYIDFLERQFNPSTVPYLMCKNQLSVDYQGNIYDCDFNQIANLPSSANGNGHKINLKTILEKESLNLIQNVQVRDYCFGCTAGSGSSCAGSLV